MKSYETISGSRRRGRTLSRLDFLKQIGIFSGAVLVGCSPIRILLKDYPNRYDRDEGLRTAILRAFVTTVIPGAPPDDPDLVRMFDDEYYPFHAYCGYFVSDLNDRSANRYDGTPFDALAPDLRREIIQQGLDADATTARLYRGAVLMAQASFYGGIYDDEKGCPLIDFHGTNNGFTPEEMCYANCRPLLAREATLTGNYS